MTGVRERRPDQKVIVASRRARVTLRGKTVTVSVTVYLPHFVRRSEWVCAYRIAGLAPRAIRDVVTGDDGIQALMLAHEAVRIELEKVRRGLAWEAGFWRYNPELYGLRFSARLNRIIDRELRRYGRSPEIRSAKARYRRQMVRRAKGRKK